MRGSKKFLGVSLLVILTLAACALPERASNRVVPESLYKLQVSYSPEEEAFILLLESYADEKICVPRMIWADEKGKHYFFEDRRVYLSDRGNRYEIKDVASGYCTSRAPGGCVNVLRKGEQLRGKVPIEDFTIPADVYRDKDFKPQFHYPFAIHFCEF